MRRWTIWLLLLLPMPCWADASAAFNDGKNLGNAVNPQNLGAIRAGSIQDKLPAYGQSVVETGYFQGGHGDTIGPGAGKVSLCAGVTADLIGKFKAGDIVGRAAAVVGGKGGGRPDMAMAGGTDAGKLHEALATLTQS